MKYLTIISIILSTILIPFELSACTCFDPTLEEATKRAKEIFLGKVVKVEQIPRTYKEGVHQYDYSIAKYTFEVTQKWKGNNDKYVALYGIGSSCDIRFEISEIPILVFASKDDYDFPENKDRFISNDKLSANQCSRTVHGNKERKHEQFKSDTTLLYQIFPNLVPITINVPRPIQFQQSLWLVIGSLILLISFCVLLLTKLIKTKNLLNEET